MISRILEDKIEKNLFQKKAILLVGPRQVGKTTLLQQIMRRIDKKSLYWNCDEPDIRTMLTLPSSTALKAKIGDAELLFIDEAQRVKDIGVTLKLMVDNCPDKQLIVTGSSALEMSNTMNEPLTGRKYEYKLLPFSVEELVARTSELEESRMLETRLIYGSYPDVVLNPGNESKILNNIVSSYLYKDIFTFQDVRKPEIIERMLQALALQVGSEVSFNELGNFLGIDSMTVRRYVDLLEKSYIIFHLHSYSRNLRTELKKSMKIYFYDNGVRNALITNYSPLDLRNDVGQLWENYLIVERLKHNIYSDFYGSYYFWRTTQQQEIDYIEDYNGILHSYEFKWNSHKKTSIVKTFANNYPDHTYEVINRENYMSFVYGK